MMLRVLLTSFMLLLIQACQVEEQISSAKQVAPTVAPVESYVVSMPTDGWKKLNDHISITLMTPYPLKVTGFPYIEAEIGTNTERLYYHSGSGTNVIVFRYVVTSADYDADGVTFSNQIELNGGSISYEPTSGLLYNAPLKYDRPQTSVWVDGIVPTFESIQRPLAGNYVTGSMLNYYLTFSEDVFVTGTPYFNAVLNSGNAAISYLSGSGSNRLQFQRQITALDLDTNGFYTLGSLNLSSPNITIKDQAGNLFTSSILPAYSLDIPTGASSYIASGAPVAAASTGSFGFATSTGTTYKYLSPGGWTALTDTTINQTGPTISSVTAPTAGSYTTGQNLNFQVNWSQAVNVTGTPGIKLQLTTGSVYASYVSGSGTSTHIYRYTVTPGNLDTDGISVTPMIELRGGTLKNVAGNANASLNFTAPNTSTVFIDSVQGPHILSITLPSSNFYLAGSVMTFSVNFNQNVTVTGTPQLQLVVGTSTINANYVAGSGSSSLLFNYNVSIGDNDLDGISLTSPLSLNGGTIKDAGGYNALLFFNPVDSSGLKVDALYPTISSVTPLGTGLYAPGQNIDFNVTLTEAVTVTGSPRISLTVGAATRYATYLSGSGSTTLTFRYTPGVGDQDTTVDGIDMVSPLDLNGGTIVDARNNAATLSYTPAATYITIDGVSASSISVAHSGNGTYKIGDNIDFTITWNENISVTGTPRLQLTVGTTTKYANYLAVGSTATVSKFRYTVTQGDLDTNGIAMASSINLNGGTIKDSMNNAASTTITPPTLTSVNVDGVRPSIVSVVKPANGSYSAGQHLTFTVNWSEAVNVVGLPAITIQLGDIQVVANYNAGLSTSMSTVYRYTITTDNLDLDGISIPNFITMSAGVSIQDISGNNAILTFPAQNLSGVLVDAVAPTIQSVAGPNPGTYVYGDTLEVKIYWSEPVNIVGTPQVFIDINSFWATATYDSISSSPMISSFKVSVPLNNIDMDGIEIWSAIALAGGTIRDSFNNNAVLTFTAPNTSMVFVDGVTPIVMSITPPTSKTYLVGEHVDFTLNFSKSMVVTGNPRLKMTIGTTEVLADYLAGDGTQSITFRYTVQANDEDLNGVSLGNNLNFLAGNLESDIGNPLWNLFYPPAYPGVKVDAKAPTIVSTTCDKIGYKWSSVASQRRITYSITFSEPVFVTGTPAFYIEVGGSIAQANYSSGHGTATLNFTYEIPATPADSIIDLDGVTVYGTFLTNGYTIRDGVNQNAPSTFTFTKKHYIHYSNIIARYRFDNDHVTLTPCGANMCITGASDISGNNAASLTAQPSHAPIQGANYGNSTQKFASLSSSTYLGIPSLSGVYYVTIVMRAPSANANSIILRRTSSTNYFWYTYVSLNNRMNMSTSFNSRRNLGTYMSSTNGSGLYYRASMWTQNAHSVYYLQSTASNFTNGFLGSSSFDGEIADIIFWSSAVNLDTTVNSQVRNATIYNHMTSLYGTN